MKICQWLFIDLQNSGDKRKGNSTLSWNSNKGNQNYMFLLLGTFFKVSSWVTDNFLLATFFHLFLYLFCFFFKIQYNFFLLTIFILYFQTQIQNSFEQLLQLIRVSYTEEEQIIIACPSLEQVSLMQLY